MFLHHHLVCVLSITEYDNWLFEKWLRIKETSHNSQRTTVIFDSSTCLSSMTLHRFFTHAPCDLNSDSTSCGYQTHTICSSQRSDRKLLNVRVRKLISWIYRSLTCPRLWAQRNGSLHNKVTGSRRKSRGRVLREE